MNRLIHSILASFLVAIVAIASPVYAQIVGGGSAGSGVGGGSNPDSVPGLPSITVTRTPSPMLAGQSYTVRWITSNADYVHYQCTSSGGGFAGSGDLDISPNNSTGTADSAWVGHNSTCVWTAYNDTGSKSVSETMVTNAGQTLTNGASIIGQTVTSPMISGQSYTATVTVQNTGTTTWTPAASYNLGALNDNYTWRSNNRVPLGTSVPPGQQYTFSFSVVAPAPGTYSFQWAMVQDGVAWFGPASNSSVTVVSATPAPTISVQRTPSPLVAAQSYTTNWSTTDATSLSYNCTANGTGFAGNASLATSGSSPGTANAAWVGYPSTCTWTAIGAGGTKTYTETMTTIAATPAPTISVSRTPNPMIAGQAYTLNWSSANATSVSYICTASGTGYASSGSVSPNGPSSGTAQAAWVGYPSTCVWTANGSGGTSSFTETMTTLAAPPTETVIYHHTDGLGSPIARTNEAGGLISKTRYEPYGMTVDGTTPPDIGFTGHVNDVDTGLTYMQQRYYDPVAGRLLSEDPVLTDANTGESFNRYVYANNSPYKYVDPDGRDVVFGVDPAGAGGNGHTTLYFQDKNGQWNSFNQGAAGETSSGGNLGFLSGMNAKAGVSIEKISAKDVPKDGLSIKTTSKQDALIADSASKSAADHNSGKVDYNLYSNNCTDAAVNVVNSAGAGITVANSSTTVKPNSWLKEVKNDPKAVENKEATK